MKINSNIDAGNIEIVSAESQSAIQLKIRKDSNGVSSQWFHFNLNGTKNQVCNIRIINASETSYAKNGWPGYNVVASYDRKEWFRIPTQYDGKHLIISHTLLHSTIYYAYFTPYSYERHLDLIASAQTFSHCNAEVLCLTPNRHEVNLLTFGEPSANKFNFWIIARQHAGEAMAEWFCEGLIQRLLDLNDPVTNYLLSKATFYVVPNMNPDGSVSGNLRANAAGIDLNRQWKEPSKEKCPEVYYVMQKQKETGVDFFFDVHGDEGLPYVFVVDQKEDPHYNDYIKELEGIFKESYKLANSDIQYTQGYPQNKHATDTQLTIASHSVGNAYNCLSFTLEMPFKDNANAPDEKVGWSSERSMQLGKALLEPLAAIIESKKIRILTKS